MYTPGGKGYHLSREEKAEFDSAVFALAALLEGEGSSGSKQVALANLLRAVAPAFSPGELRAAVRISGVVKLGPVDGI